MRMWRCVSCLVVIILTCVSAEARYYIVWNGVQDANNVTAYVGDIINLGFGSTDTTPTGPDLYWGKGGGQINDYSGFCTWLSSGKTSAAGFNSYANPWGAQFPGVVNCRAQFPASPGIWFNGKLLMTGPGFLNMKWGYYRVPDGVFVTYTSINVKVLPNPGSGTRPSLVALWNGDHAQIEDGNKVSVLLDQSGNGYNVHRGRWYDSNDANDYRPAIVRGALHGHDVVQFNGNQFLQYKRLVTGDDPNWTAAQQYSWFLVVKDMWPDFTDNPGFNGYMLSNIYQNINAPGDTTNYSDVSAWGLLRQYYVYGASNVVNYYTFAPSLSYGARRAMEWSQIYGTTASDSGWIVLTGVWAGPGNTVTVDGDLDGWVNTGKQLNNLGDTLTSNYLAGHVGTFLGVKSEKAIGDTVEGPQFWTGQLAEVRIYRGAMGLAQVQGEIAKLRCKYGFGAGSLVGLKTIADNWLMADPPAGDYSFDNKVNFIDYAAWSWGFCD